MQYRAVMRFADLNDGKHLYEAGDIFPREGLTVTAKRLAELSSGNNRAGLPLIEAVIVKDEKPKAPRKRVKRDD